MIEDFPELSDDNYIAFMQLEAEFRTKFEKETGDEQGQWEYEAGDYMNRTIAAAKALDIDALSAYETTAEIDFARFNLFRRDVDNILIQMRVHHSRRSKAMSVGFTAEQKTKIHALVQKMRTAIEDSSAQVDKKEKLFKIIAKLSEEVDKPRTGLERFGDLARGLASVSRDVEEEGARPWWKWYQLAMGVVDDAKEAEPQLPKPVEPKQIEPPRKELPKPKTIDDDEIPF
ncbi:hypothetical protein K3740_06675 [Ruegeria conchae]|uniref:hypothetical protein n=1 Tax=Ruegeria conchae TaxID=981384 RepID=UPI0021A3A378|nr:hypothetical protein [Ruegeria conchae]UWR04360.1 hypothetical protein K3740_06675 [Ruegeria conchae]